jgi:hypothetical protein
MLLCNDVLDMMGERTVLLAEPAVFAPAGGPLLNKVPRGRVHG